MDERLQKMIDYSGTENLEVMVDAVNYNRYLIEKVLKYARPGDRIVDFGAGIGTFAHIVSESGYNVCCIEPDQKQALVIKKIGLEVYSELNQIDNESVDYMYMLNVLEHIKDDQAALCNIYRKLKKGGRLTIYVPAFQILYSSMDRKVGHYRRYTKGVLVGLVSNAGFSVEYSRYADSVGFAATILYKLVGDELGSINNRALKLYDRFAFPLSLMADRLFGSFIGKNIVLVGVKY